MAIVLSVIYLAVILGTGIREVGHLPWTSYLWASISGLLLYPLSILAQATAWALALGMLRTRAFTFDWSDVQVYASSHLIRRLPGGVWYVGERVSVYRGNGFQATMPIAASAAEWGLLVVSAGVLYLASEVVLYTGATAAVVGALVVVGVIGWLAGSLLGRKLRLPSGTRGSDSGPTPKGLVGFVYLIAAELYLGAFIVGGLILQPFLNSGGNREFGLVQAIGIWAIVGGIGTVISFLPAGIGIREASLVIILASYLSPPAPVVIALLMRLLFVLGDLLWGSTLLLLATYLRSSLARQA